MNTISMPDTVSVLYSVTKYFSNHKPLYLANRSTFNESNPQSYNKSKPITIHCKLNSNPLHDNNYITMSFTFLKPSCLYTVSKYNSNQKSILNTNNLAFNKSNLEPNNQSKPVTIRCKIT